MKIVNLDKFKNTTQVTLDGSTYSVRGITVREFLEDTISKRLQDAKDERETALIMIDILTGLTDIPREVLLEQEFEIIRAIIMIAQGGDPDKGDDPKN